MSSWLDALHRHLILKQPLAEGTIKNGKEYKIPCRFFYKSPSHEEGRIIKNNGNFEWQFHLTDHLGDTRLLFADQDNDGEIDAETELLSVKNYYPFGMLWENGLSTSPKMSYGYNGKELDTDFGLNVHFYGTRLHDAALGRFTTIDRIADNFAFVSPYNYAENRVPNGIDLYGLQYAPFGPATFHSKSFNKAQHAKDVKQFISQNAGNEIAIGFTPAGVALDFRDVGVAIQNKDGIGLVLAGIGFIPGGDFIKGFRNSIEDKAKDLVQSLRKSDRGPVVTGVLDTKTGDTFFDINNGNVDDLHPILSNRLKGLEERTNGAGNRPEYINEIPGTHSEIGALNQALKARGDVSEDQLGEFLMHNRSLRGSTKITGVPPRCSDCAELTKGVNFIE